MTRSLSNLYKQWFVQTDSTNTRIIDSNVILQQHLKQDLPQTQTPAQNVQEEEGGFSAGLVTGDPGQVIKAEPQIDYEAKAKAKAEEILAAAQQNADAILAQANEDAEEIRTSAKTQGYEEGRASAEQENEQLRVQLEESYRKSREILTAITGTNANIWNRIWWMSSLPSLKKCSIFSLTTKKRY